MIKRKSFSIKHKNPRQRSKTASGRTKPPKSISKLIKEADRLFSIKVRAIHPSFIVHPSIDVMNLCFTCELPFPIKKLHCGHYLSRYYKAARWDFDNARPQCMMCNLWKRGDPIRFRQNLVKEIGEGKVLILERKRDDSIKLTREFLLEKIQELS